MLAKIAFMYEVDPRWLLLGTEAEAPDMPELVAPKDIHMLGIMMRQTLRLVLELFAVFCEMRDVLEELRPPKESPAPPTTTTKEG